MSQHRRRQSDMHSVAMTASRSLSSAIRSRDNCYWHDHPLRFFESHAVWFSVVHHIERRDRIATPCVAWLLTARSSDAQKSAKRYVCPTRCQVGFVTWSYDLTIPGRPTKTNGHLTIILYVFVFRRRRCCWHQIFEHWLAVRQNLLFTWCRSADRSMGVLLY